MIYSPDYAATFTLFSPSHIITMLFWVIVWIAIPLLLRRKGTTKVSKIFCVGLAVLLIGQYLGWMLWEAITGNFTLQLSLPMNLCDFSNFLCAVLLLTKNRRLFEVLYFWVLGGVVQSFVTPNISFPFPHFEFWVFYLQHGGMILVILYMMVVERMRPKGISVVRSLGWIVPYLAVVYLFNLLTGSNYSFLMADSPNPSMVTRMIGVFGNPPRHLIGLGLILAATYTILYVPFYLHDLLRRFKNR